MKLKPYTGPHSAGLYYVVDDQDRVIRNASVLEVKLWEELEQVKQQRQRLVDALTPEIVDWAYCGLATNGRLKQESPMAQWYELKEALENAKVNS